jgi:hypothetical protein
MRSTNKTQSTQKKTKSFKNVPLPTEIFYATPSKPLDFSFKELNNFEEIIKTEPRAGIRKSIEEAIKIKDENAEGKDPLNEENPEPKQERRKRETQKFEVNDVVEAKMNMDVKMDNKGGKIGKIDETKAGGPKRKIKYVNYTNAIILHSNQIRSFEKVDYTLNTILPDIDFFAMPNRNKLDLIQWIDISHNKIEEIHPDLLNLKFLKILYCHANHIKEIEKIMILNNCQSLLNLTLHGNPIEQIKGYRQFVVEIVPSLEKLDFTLVSEKELDIIFHKGSRWGEKRNRNGEVIEYPKLDPEILKRMIKSDDDVMEKKEEE